MNPLRILIQRYPWIIQYRFETGIVFATYFLFGTLIALEPLDNPVSVSWRILFGFICCYSASFFACFVNDVFDAPYDALDAKKHARNLFCTKYKEERLFPYSILVFAVIISLGTAFFLGPLAV